jgi:CheY-like chemotaxis protein
MSAAENEHPRTVLIVEDDPTLRRIFGKVVVVSGHPVEEVRSAEEGLRLLCQEGLQACMVLVDRGLPGMRGDRFAGELSHELRSAAPPVVLVTGSDVPLPDGFVEVVMKPVSAEALQDLVRRHCSCGVRSGVHKVAPAAAESTIPRAIRRR